MYVLYLDESGNPGDPADKNFVLAGITLPERSIHFLAQQMDAVQTKHFPGSPPIEFHANAIKSGRGFWRRVDKEKREAVLTDIGAAIAQVKEGNVIAFAAVIEKDYEWHSEAAIRKVLEIVCNRFNLFLKIRYKDYGDQQRGLLVFAESQYQQRAKIWVNDFKRLGTQWGVLANVCDIPYFASTAESRLLQAADYVSYSVFQLYEHRASDLISPIFSRFHTTDGVIHSLVHWTRGRGATCECPACASRRISGSIGTWFRAITSEHV